MTIEIAVVTRVPPNTERGNLAMADPDLVVQMDEAGDDYAPIMEAWGAEGAAVFLAMRKPVFRLGEILLLDENGRDIDGSGGGRNPSKWDIEITRVDSLTEARALSERVYVAQLEEHSNDPR